MAAFWINTEDVSRSYKMLAFFEINIVLCLILIQFYVKMKNNINGLS